MATMITIPLKDGSIAFEIKDKYAIVKQVHNHGDPSTNGSNNVGWWVVLSTNLEGLGLERGLGLEYNDLHALLTSFSETVR